MAFGGDVDTLSLTFDKLQYIFNGYGQIRDSFVDANMIRKQGGISDPEFFDLVNQGIMRFSALEFLAIKAVFEIKKSLDRDTAVNVFPGSEADASSTPGHSLASFITAKSLPKSHHVDTVLEANTCGHCGNRTKTKAKFCSSCGKKL